MRMPLRTFLTTTIMGGRRNKAVATTEPDPMPEPVVQDDLPLQSPSDDAGNPVPARVPWWQRWRPSLAISAFTMSLTITLISAFTALKGSEIVVLPPDQVLLYRDGEGEAAVLTMAMRLDMINAASAHGDVLLDATIQPGTDGPAFRYQSLVRPVFTDTSTGERTCAFGSRCIELPGLYLIETVDDIVAMPGGSARSTFLSFPAAEWNCKGTPEQCRSYASFNQAVAAIRSDPIEVTVRVKFHEDGGRDVVCRGAAANTDYLKLAGWIAAPCAETDISGEPFL